MARILSVKDQTVTRGVLDKDVSHEPDLREITFVDAGNTPHTIFVHAHGPFADPQAAIRAWEDGEIHLEPSPQPAPETPAPPQGWAVG